MQMSERKSEYIAGPEPEWSDEEERVEGHKWHVNVSDAAR
jgi:hypothetical protein